MPRQRKRQQPVATSPGQPYGVSSEQQAAMAQLPLPDNAIDPSAPVAVPDQSTGVSMPPEMAAIADAAAMPPPMGGLGGDSSRPDEPITAGLDHGPGPNRTQAGLPPRGRRVDGNMTRTLQAIADLTGSPEVASLLQQARRRGA